VNSQAILNDRQEFVTISESFFHELFGPALESDRGAIEIRTFKPLSQQFFRSECDAAAAAYTLLNQGVDVYFGVNPRIGGKGKKENVHYVSAFHAEVDYGDIGHKKESRHKTREEALKAIQEFEPEPTLVVHSGGGFHCYWVLSNPVKVETMGIETLEGINKGISIKIGGDSGTQDISRVLRVPGTLNFKVRDDPRPVTIISCSGRKYVFDDFKTLAAPLPATNVKPIRSGPPTEILKTKTPAAGVARPELPERTMRLIKSGNDGSYPSRSETDMAVISVLVNKGFSDAYIKSVFQTEAIGEKYREHPDRDKYLSHSIKKAKEMSLLTEEEMQDPLFITGAIEKREKKYSLNGIRFEEYMVRKHMIRILDQEGAFFLYNGRAYEQCTDKTLNNLCQNELGPRRNLFTKSSMGEFMHFAIGDALVESEKARADQVRYLTLQNGLYDLEENKLIEHTKNIFTTNLLPYDYDPKAECPRFIQFLEEIFMCDHEKMDFIQEAVGYAFHKSLPTPSVFFLVGSGSNGKSVFINTIASLVGKENTSNVSFNALSDEYYVLELFQKMINISGETPHGKAINADALKAVTSGDWITGREVYKRPVKFRPFAKHFLAMNKAPIITDQSHGMWRRIWIVEFNRRFTQEDMDRELEGKLANELSGIFNWALEGYKRLKNRKFALSEPVSMKMAKREYRDDLDSVRSFIKTSLSDMKNSPDQIIFKETYDTYRNYCQTEGIKDIKTKNDFKKTLIEMGYRIESSTKQNNKVCIFCIQGNNINTLN